MSVNPYLPHILILPEDDANRRLARAFHEKIDRTRYRQLQVLRVAGGWNEVLRRFNENQIHGMDRWPQRLMILLIDFDGEPDRLESAKAKIPGHLTERVFILGTLTEPEDLRADLGAFESIGSELANDCLNETETTWGHPLLRHNVKEIVRLRESIRPILF